MAAKYDVKWTSEAKQNVDGILSFIREHWSEKECEDFLDFIQHFEKTISYFPQSFKESVVLKGCRLGLIHKHITAIYSIKGKSVIVLTVIDNRSSKEK